VLIPEAVDFGSVRAGERVTPQTVWISFRGGSLVHTVRLEASEGRFWHATVAQAEDERSVRIHLAGRPLHASSASGRLMVLLRVQVDESAVEVPLSVTVEAAPWRYTLPPSRPPRPNPGSTAPPPRQYAAGRFSKRTAIVLTLVLAIVLIGRFGLHLLGGSAPKTSGRSSEYCSVSSDDFIAWWSPPSRTGREAT